jgi:hypothetical protein
VPGRHRTSLNQAFRDPRHSADHGIDVDTISTKSLAVEAKMQRVTAMMAYVVSEGRLCALKPAEWSLLLAGVTLCGIATLLFLMLHA